MGRFFRIAVLLLALFAGSEIASAQVHSDVGSWCSVMVNKSWNKAYGFARAEHRSFDKLSSTQAFFCVGGVGYRFVPWLSTDLSYEYWNTPHSGIKSTHKAVLGVAGTLRRDALSINLREKYELAFPMGGKVNGTLRSRLRAQYKFQSSVFSPYVMYEIFSRFSGEKWVRSLHYVGTDINFSKHHSLDVFYMFHLFPSGASNSACHVLGVGYNLIL